MRATAPIPIRFAAEPRNIRLVRVPPERAAERRRAAELEAAGYERGRRDAERGLNAQLLAQRREMLELQNGFFRSLEQALPQVRRDCEQALAALAMEVAHKLVADLPITAEMIEGAVRETLDQIDEATEYHIHLHPEDLKRLQTVDHALLSEGEPGRRLHFHPSPAVTPGGCLVKTHFGVVDGRRENKMAMLKQAVLS